MTSDAGMMQFHLEESLQTYFRLSFRFKASMNGRFRCSNPTSECRSTVWTILARKRN